MTSSISREEADKISGDFEKIASRDSKSKATKSNIKIVLVVVTVMVVILLILVYVYFKGPGIIKLNSKPTSPQAEFSVGAEPQLPQALQNSNYSIHGGQPIEL